MFDVFTSRLHKGATSTAAQSAGFHAAAAATPRAAGPAIGATQDAPASSTSTDQQAHGYVEPKGSFCECYLVVRSQ